MIRRGKAKDYVLYPYICMYIYVCRREKGGGGGRGGKVGTEPRRLERVVL